MQFRGKRLTGLKRKQSFSTQNYPNVEQLLKLARVKFKHSRGRPVSVGKVRASCCSFGVWHFTREHGKQSFSVTRKPKEVDNKVDERVTELQDSHRKKD